MRVTSRVLVGLVALTALTATAAVGVGVDAQPRVHDLSWVVPAAQHSVNATATKQMGTVAPPAVLMETKVPAYDDQVHPDIEIFLSMDPRGYGDPVTLYLYWQDRVSGTKSFITVPDGLLAEGESKDFFGGATPTPIYVPTLNRLKLFGPDGALGEAPEATRATGRYQFVMEVRDAAGAEVLSRSAAMFAWVDGTQTLSGSVTSDTTLTADTLYILQGAVFVEDGAALTIEPGTVVLGDNGSKGTLVVAQGGQLIADGTAMQPIIMTSPFELGQRGPQDWGGLILNGRATLNTATGTSEGEGDTGTFGGQDDTDSSGVLRYVRVEFAGIEFSPENELNGIAFQGTGSGTVVDHVQVHFNEDDGIEFFGGTTSAKYLLLTGILDDSLDWTMGWRGNAQFVVAVQYGGASDGGRGIEADNFDEGHDNLPRANPQIYNMTLIGSGDTGPQGENGMKLRRGTAGNFYNSVVYGFREKGIDVDDDATGTQIAEGNLVMDYSIVINNGSWTGDPNIEDGDATTLFNNGANNRLEEPMLASPFYTLVPDVTPLEGSPLRDGSFFKSPPDNGFFEPVDFGGGVNPGDNWTLEGWTIYSKN